MDFDRLFGTWVEYVDYKKEGSIKGAKEAAQKRVSKSPAKKEQVRMRPSFTLSVSLSVYVCFSLSLSLFN